ncbi:hypothetical protein TYRP_017557 [Tyrophagus putrescentiae]|nr:hypothetical protein TYRP_017557 [Tyrophagus putrescentiae]
MPQLLIWAKPMDIFFENHGLSTDALKNIAPSDVPRRPISAYSSSNRVHQQNGFEIQISGSAHHPIGPPVYHPVPPRSQV